MGSCLKICNPFGWIIFPLAIATQNMKSLKVRLIILKTPLKLTTSLVGTLFMGPATKMNLCMYARLYVCKWREASIIINIELYVKKRMALTVTRNWERSHSSWSKNWKTWINARVGKNNISSFFAFFRVFLLHYFFAFSTRKLEKQLRNVLIVGAMHET